MKSELALQLHTWRTDEGYSQKGLAKELNLTRITIWRWENDKQFPDQGSLHELQKLTDWSDAHLKALKEQWDTIKGRYPQYRIRDREIVVSEYGGDYRQFTKALFDATGDTMGIVSEPFQGTVDDRAAIFRSSPQTWRVLTSHGNIVGSWQFVCLTEEYFERVRNGVFVDNELRETHLEFPDYPGDYLAYITAIFRDQSVNDIGIGELLLKSFAGVLEDLAKDGAYVKEFAAFAFTTKGRRFAQKLGMDPIGLHDLSSPDTPIYRFHMMGQHLLETGIGKAFPSLAARYADHFTGKSEALPEKHTM